MCNLFAAHSKHDCAAPFWWYGVTVISKLNVLPRGNEHWHCCNLTQIQANWQATTIQFMQNACDIVFKCAACNVPNMHILNCNEPDANCLVQVRRAPQNTCQIFIISKCTVIYLMHDKHRIFNSIIIIEGKLCEWYASYARLK